MKLVTYSLGGERRTGARVDAGVIDLERAHRDRLRARGSDALAPADGQFPTDMLRLLQGGDACMQAAHRAVAHVVERFEHHGEALRATGVWLDPDAIELCPPVLRPGKVLGVGFNYVSHAREAGHALPEYPALYHKGPTSLVGHHQPIMLPDFTDQVYPEGELGVVIGRRCKNVTAEDALCYVAGYCCVNDVNALDIVFRTSQWATGAMIDTFCPVGPVLVTRDEIDDPQTLRVRTSINGVLMQDGRTSDMHYTVARLVAYISRFATLEPGDIIATGTPPGVSAYRDPPIFLRPGDEVTVEVDGIGRLNNPVECSP